MPKISRPIVYTALGALGIYAAFLYTQPATPTASRTVHVIRSVQTADANGMLPQDLAARFPRYSGGKRDPFVPGVAIARPKPQAAANPLTGARNGWALTGINSVNGVASAVIENSATGDSAFLQPGDRWNGLRVVEIGHDQVVFQNAIGHRDALTFAQPPDTETASTRGFAVGSAPRLPSFGSAQIAPYPVAPLQVTPFPAASAPADTSGPDTQSLSFPPPGPPNTQDESQN